MTGSSRKQIFDDKGNGDEQLGQKLASYSIREGMLREQREWVKVVGEDGEEGRR